MSQTRVGVTTRVAPTTSMPSVIGSSGPPSSLTRRACARTARLSASA